MAEQLSFDLPRRTARAREDFFVSPANALAVALIDDWRNWPGGKLALSGPAGSGKTHLTHVWAAHTGARIVPAGDLTEDAVPDLAQGPVAVEDVPEIAADPRAQAALFHLHNLVLAQGHRLLMTGRDAPRHWGLTLPDLQSRVEGAQNATLDEPDDALLAAVLAKLFADRQITPRPDVIPFLLLRVERSFAAAAAVVDHLDRGALKEGKPLTRQLAARLLADFRSHGDGSGD
ncbi:P-loop NTPase family protein [Jhaorihella thermophila]|uniref:DnaA protein n=1 Tax=Jhaorihella thermophila TaxID=488547 RepID=A0A1H5Y4D1_9RHOB|nr:DnaA/Hda family protein [Jhaorihella thermophila]SEG18655.1 dnaA protein [Jhaorihella thermophila]